MRARLFFFLIAVINIELANALDVDEIFKFDVCAGTRASVSEEQLENLKNSRGEFPRWGYNLGPTVATVDRMNSLLSSSGQCKAFSPVSKPLNPVLIALAEVTKKTAELLANDLRAQRGLVGSGYICTRLLLEHAKKIGRGTDDPVSLNIGSKIYAAQEGKLPSPKQCEQFISKFVPELQARYTRMRQALALSDGHPRQDVPLKHDVPYLSFLTENFLGSVWKSGREIQGLNAREMEGLKDVMKNLEAAPKTTYFQILSTSPILLFFNQGIDVASLDRAFGELEKQNKVDIGDLVKNPPQEMMLYTSYVLKALQTLPDSQRGDACLAVKSIYKNLVTRYETIPRALNIAGILTSIPNPSLWVAGGSKLFFAAMMKRSSAALAVTNASSAMDKMTLYRKSIEICNSIAQQKVDAPKIDGACSLQRTNQHYLDAESDIVTGAVFGASVFGVGKVVGLFAK